MNTKNIKFLILFFLPNLLFAQNDLKLSDAVSKGLENNFQMKVIKKNVEIAENNNSWGNAGRYPNLTVGVHQNNRYDDSESQIPTEDRNKVWRHTVSPFANLRWTIFGGFAVNITKKNFESLYEMSKGNEQIMVESTIQTIIISYYAALMQKEKLEVNRKVMKLSSDRYNYILARQELGNAVTFNVLQEKNSYLSDSANYLMQKNSYENAIRNLKFAMGDTSNVKYNPADEFSAKQKNFNIEDLKEQMKNENKTLKNRYINLKISENQLKMTKNSRLPTLSLNAGYDYMHNVIRPEGVDSYNNWSQDLYANFTLSFNVFSGGATRRNIQNKTIENEINKLEIEEMELSLNNQLTNLYEFYNNRKQLYQLAEENMKASKLNLEIAQEKYKNGSINSFNYRDIQMVYIQTSIARLQSIYNLIDTETQILRLTGGIVSAKN